MRKDGINISKVTRLEVITDKGRVFSKEKSGFTFSLQDQGRTLKIFDKIWMGKATKDDKNEGE